MPPTSLSGLVIHNRHRGGILWIASPPHRLVDDAGVMPRCARSHDVAGLDALAESQDRVVSRTQLSRVGWNRGHISAAVAARRWASYGEQALVLHQGTLTRRQSCWVAVLNGGPGAALAGLTAAAEHGLTGFETDVIHIVVSKDGWVPRDQSGVKVHISRRFHSSDRHPARTPPTVRASRAVVDAAAWSRNSRRACALVIAAVQQRLVRVDDLRTELDTAGRVRHRRLLRAVLDDVEGGVRALSELDFTRLTRRYGLPEPELQRKRTDGSGRIRYLDARLRRRDGRIVNIEIDGAAHANVLDSWADAERDIAFLAQGEPTIRISSVAQRIDPAGVARRIRRVLEAPF